MFLMLIAMVLILAVAAAVVVYVAYPHRGADVPGATWVGEAMKRGVDALPVLEGEFDGPRIPLQESRRLLHPDEDPAPSAVEPVQDGPTRA